MAFWVTSGVFIVIQDTREDNQKAEGRVLNRHKLTMCEDTWIQKEKLLKLLEFYMSEGATSWKEKGDAVLLDLF